MTSATWTASSRVGTRTRPVGRLGWALPTRSASGRPNASVLPEPVLALPQTSRPARASGMQRRWTGNGVVRPDLSRTSTKSGDTPSAENVSCSSVRMIAAHPTAPTCARPTWSLARLAASPGTPVMALAEVDDLDRPAEAADALGPEADAGEPLAGGVEQRRGHQELMRVGLVAQPGGEVDRPADVVVALEQDDAPGGQAGPQRQGAAPGVERQLHAHDGVEQRAGRGRDEHGAVAKPLGHPHAPPAGALAHDRPERRERGHGLADALLVGQRGEAAQVDEAEVAPDERVGVLVGQLVVDIGRGTVHGPDARDCGTRSGTRLRAPARTRSGGSLRPRWSGGRRPDGPQRRQLLASQP